MTRYYIEFEDRIGEWFCDHLETPTPSTIAEAADLLGYVRGHYDLADNFRVTVVSSCGRGSDVTDHVEAFIDAREAEAALEAAEDDAHERQDRHGWEQV